MYLCPFLIYFDRYKIRINRWIGNWKLPETAKNELTDNQKKQEEKASWEFKLTGEEVNEVEKKQAKALGVVMLSFLWSPVTAAHFNTLQHITTHCYTATRCNTLYDSAPHCNTLLHMF